jgi:D-glycero-alpha-D-manno-heptose-7-phosphate kinase
MRAHTGVFQSAEQLAAEASRIEIDELKEPIGKQDQYAAAYGGLRAIRFLPSGEVTADPVICAKSTRDALEASVLLFYTGLTRSASAVLSEQKANTDSRRETLREMKALADRFRDSLQANEPTARAGDLLHQGWLLKKSLASGIASSQIDEWYERARGAGAWGGKILGAGGGGFLMVLCDPARQPAVRKELSELRPLAVRLESQGSKIIFIG